MSFYEEIIKIGNYVEEKVISRATEFPPPAGRNFHKQTIGRFLKFCEHSVSSKDMSEPIGEFIF